MIAHCIQCCFLLCKTFVGAGWRWNRGRPGATGGHSPAYRAAGPAPRQSATSRRLRPAVKPRKGLEALSSALSRPCRRSGIIDRAAGAMRRTPFYSVAIGANVVHAGFFAHPSEQGGNSQHRCSHRSDDDGRESQQGSEQQTEDSQRDAEGQDAADDAHALTVSLRYARIWRGSVPVIPPTPTVPTPDVGCRGVGMAATSAIASPTQARMLHSGCS